MSKLNPNTKSAPKTRLAGGSGAFAAKQGNYSLLRRAVLSCLLFEDLAYESGAKNANNIANLIPTVTAQDVADLAVEARLVQKLRHVPLYMVSEMAKHDTHKSLVAETLEKVITRPDQITDFVAIYWRDGKKLLTKQIKLGLAASFAKFNEFSFAKYDRDGAIKLRDVMRLVHPKPTPDKVELYKKVATRTLETPDTWEVALSSGADKKVTWTRLINENKLGALAFLRNLRNMKQANVDATTIRKGFKQVKSQMLLPLNFFGAAQHAPEFKSDINNLMLRTYQDLPKLPGKTIFVVDVSGSMGSGISGKSAYTRHNVATAMAALAHELCEEVEIWCTAGSDSSCVHQTAKIDYPKRGLDIVDQIDSMKYKLGGGGIFTRQCLEHIEAHTGYTPDRVIVFSDSADCDRRNPAKPRPFGKNNYIVDVSAHANGVNYNGVWTAEVSGFSEHFLTYIAAIEGLSNDFEED